jgi:hypothetical protein
LVEARTREDAADRSELKRSYRGRVTMFFEENQTNPAHPFRRFQAQKGALTILPFVGLLSLTLAFSGFGALFGVQQAFA